MTVEISGTIRKSPCDCCGKIAVLRHAEVCGVETYACAECHGYPADEFDYLLDDDHTPEEDQWTQ